MGMFVQQAINGLTIGFVYVLVALGFTMVFGVLRMTNFSHSELFMLGPLLGFYELSGLKIIQGIRAVLTRPLSIGEIAGVVLLCFVSAALFCATLGILIERFTLRPLRDRPTRMMMISALGVQTVLRNGAMLFGGRALKGFPRLIPTKTFEVSGAVFSTFHIFLVVLCTLLLVVLFYLVNSTRLGRAIRAVAEDRGAAALMGVDVDRTIRMVFIIGPALGAIGGVFFSMYYGTAHYSMGLQVGMKAWTAAVMGGIGNIPGAVAAGLVLGVVEAIGAGYLPILTNGVLGPEYKSVFAFIILVLVLVLRPQGIFGEAIEAR